jgi:hypothetical protein
MGIDKNQAERTINALKIEFDTEVEELESRVTPGLFVTSSFATALTVVAVSDIHSNLRIAA